MAHRLPPCLISGSAPHVGRVCCWFSFLLREVFLRVIRFPSPQNPNVHILIRSTYVPQTSIWYAKYIDTQIKWFIYFNTFKTNRGPWITFATHIFFTNIPTFPFLVPKLLWYLSQKQRKHGL